MHDREQAARELRAVAPILAGGRLIGPVVLVRHAGKILGATDPELLRPHVGAELAIATMLDGSAIAPVGHWGLGRSASLALVELAASIEPGLDVRPLELGAVGASLDTRGAPAALVGVAADGAGFARTYAPVHLDQDGRGPDGRGPDGRGPGAAATRLASPIDDIHVGMTADGAALFAWFPPNPALGRVGEVLALGVARAYRGFHTPRAHPVIAEIVGLDDLGRALLAAHKLEEHEPELRQIAGEIEDRGAAAGPAPARPKPRPSS